MKKLLLSLILALAGAAFAQTRFPNPVVLPQYTLAAGANHLPSAASFPNGLALISDGTSPCDVTSAGGGTTLVPIKSDGTSWTCLGGGGSIQNNLGNITGATSLPVTLGANNSYSGTQTGNITLTQAATPSAGYYLSYSFTENATGGFDITWPSGFSVVPTLTTAQKGANCQNTFLFRWDGAAAVFQGAASTCTPVPVQAIDSTNYWIKDDFPDTRLSTSGNIGELGWGFVCPTLAPIASVANHFGVLNMQAGAVNGNTCLMRMNTSGTLTTNQTALNSLSAGQLWEYLTVFQITSPATTTQTLKGGLGSADADTGTSCAGNCIQWLFDPSVSANFQLLTCAAGVCTTTGAAAGAISVAINTWYQIRIYSTVSGTVQMEVRQAGNTQTQSTASNVPSGGMTPYYYLKNNNTQPNIQLDYFHFKEVGLARF